MADHKLEMPERHPALDAVLATGSLATEAPRACAPVARPLSDPAAPRSPDNPWPRYAALDLGTNNCRLLIARPDGAGLRVVDAFSRIVRLGEGVSQTGMLAEAAMVRTLEALAVCRDKIEERGATRTRLVATEACRAAANGVEFLARVERETGLQLEVLGRDGEAELAAAGCSALADPRAASVILFDIGGGSTELVWLEVKGAEHKSIRARIRAWTSLPVGVVTLAERFNGHAVTPASYEAMVQATSVALAPFAQREAARAAREPNFHLLGTSGTVTTIGGIALGLDRYDRRRVDGLWMSQSDITSVIQTLISMDFDTRAANGCIGRERADLVLPGCAIFEAIRRAFPTPRLRIGDRGLREGMLIEMMREDGVLRAKKGK